MSRGKKKSLQGVLISMLVLGLTAGFIGCSDDNSPVSVTQTGTIAVNVAPDGIGASWVISNQDKLVAEVQGDSILTNLDAGKYTITWNAVAGWVSPTPGKVTADLGEGASLEITGAYMQEPGTVVIDVNDNTLNAGWTLTDPDGVQSTGQGDVSFDNMALGTYTVTWGDVPDYVTPAAEDLILTNGGTVTFTGEYVIDVPTDYVLVPQGVYTLGSQEGEAGREHDEALHTVVFSKNILMLSTEVTEKLWDGVMGGSSTSLMPKNNVSWDDAVAFCNAMSEAQGYTPAYSINGTSGDATWNKDANGYRLPTEAEWECAARAGVSTAFPGGTINQLFCDLDENLSPYAWYCANSDAELHQVGQKEPNAWGLYDMNGNLWEWCYDGYNDDYASMGMADPVCDGSAGATRIVRGGGYSSFTHFCRLGGRSSAPVNLVHPQYGFRIVRTIQ